MKKYIEIFVYKFIFGDKYYYSKKMKKIYTTESFIKRTFSDIVTRGALNIAYETEKDESKTWEDFIEARQYFFDSIPFDEDWYVPSLGKTAYKRFPEQGREDSV